MPPKSKAAYQAATTCAFGDLNFKGSTPKEKQFDVPTLLKELKETESKSLFEFL
jgi:hypothetical protein